LDPSVCNGAERDTPKDKTAQATRPDVQSSASQSVSEFRAESLLFSRLKHAEPPYQGREINWPHLLEFIPCINLQTIIKSQKLSTVFQCIGFTLAILYLRHVPFIMLHIQGKITSRK